MDTYAEFQIKSLRHQGWVGPRAARLEWVTISAPNQGADFSSGAGGVFLRERFGYEPRKSRSWRLLMQYSMASASQTEMFARIRGATDQGKDAFGLGEDWTRSVESVARAAREHAPLHGLAGMSEGATVASVLLVQHALGTADLGSGLETLLTFCALTSPAHAEAYREVGLMRACQSLHLVGRADTRDIHHMVGRTAALFGACAGVGHFAGGHKLPKRDAVLTSCCDRLRRRRLGYSRVSSLPPRSRGDGDPTLPVAAKGSPAIDLAPGTVGRSASVVASLVSWYERGVVAIDAATAGALLSTIVESVSCYAVILSTRAGNACCAEL